MSVALSLAALASGAVASWLLVRPRPPVEPERAFKAAMAAGLRSRGWADADIARAVAWHPAGVMPERLLVHPAEVGVDGAPPGLDAWRAALAGAPDASSRWALWRGGEAGLPGDAPLPEAHDPRARLGPRFGVEALADGTAAAEAETRWRLAWRWIDGAAAASAPDVLAGVDPAERVDLGAIVPPDAACRATLGVLAGHLGALSHATALDWAFVRLWGGAWSTVAFSEARAALASALSAGGDGGTRRVLAAVGAAAPVLLEVLADDAQLRDTVAAVVSIGGAQGGHLAEIGPWSMLACEDRLGRDMRHAFLDTEVVQAIPWAHLVWLDPTCDPPGLDGLPAASQRWPEPGFDGREEAFVERTDLGALPVGEGAAPPDVVRDALRVTVDLLVGTRACV